MSKTNLFVSKLFSEQNCKRDSPGIVLHTGLNIKTERYPAHTAIKWQFCWELYHDWRQEDIIL